MRARTCNLACGKEKRMAVKTIQAGQVWRSDENGQNYLVTKLYTEVFSQFAILRLADSGASATGSIRVKVVKNASGATLPGYTFTQDSDQGF